MTQAKNEMKPKQEEIRAMLQSKEERVSLIGTFVGVEWLEKNVAVADKGGKVDVVVMFKLGVKSPTPEELVVGINKSVE